MTSSNGNIFHFVRGIHRWIPLTKASDAMLWCFLWSALEQTVIRDAGDLRRHCAHCEVTATVFWMFRARFLSLALSKFSANYRTGYFTEARIVMRLWTGSSMVRVLSLPKPMLIYYQWGHPGKISVELKSKYEQNKIFFFGHYVQVSLC